MRILVTGASGLLGLNLALEAAGGAEKHVVYGTVHTHGLNVQAFTALPLDLRQPGAVERLLEQTRPDWVIHCAALANVDACENDPQQAQQMNSEVPAKLAEHVARGGARLLHVSTDAVFDGARGDYREEDEPHPLGVYARSKLDGERAVAQADPQAIIARVNLFGWSMSGSRSLGEFFFNNLSAGKRVVGFTDVLFCPLLANHLAQLFLEMLSRRLSGLYHVVSRECSSKYAFGLAVARRFGLDESLITPASVEQAGLRAARSPNLTLRTEKLRAALGHPTPDIAAGVEEFYRLHEQGYGEAIKELWIRDEGKTGKQVNR
ncbi:MAG: SDR family oxidoreductase [Chloroflexi bacterium]|nr:SDR family oxidoreductase [Chloroflexota bacterium]